MDSNNLKFIEVYRQTWYWVARLKYTGKSRTAFSKVQAVGLLVVTYPEEFNLSIEEVSR